MANKEHLDVLNQGVEKWSQWRQRFSDVRPDLTEANLAGADLTKTLLGNTFIGFDELPRVIIGDDSLGDISLRGVDLYDADLSRANLSRANLSTTVALCCRQSPLEPIRSQTQKLRSGDVGLEGGRHLLEPRAGELVRTAKRADILVPVDATIGQPTAGRAPFVAVGAPAPLLTQEA
jgi:hypothetical protein